MAISTEDSLEFHRLNSIISVFSPATPQRPPVSLADPTTIIICPWLGVHPKSRTLNSIYTKYSTLYPNARIVSIRTLPQYFFTTPTSSRLSSIRPIISAIESDPAPEKRILVHVFSNGGAVTFSDVCRIYKQRSGIILPVKAIVFDSAPGDPSFKEGWVTVSSSGAIPKNLLWYPAGAVVVLVLGMMWIGKNILGLQMLIDRSRVELNDEGLVDRKAKRLYVYSDVDRVVGWRDVERHAEEARVKGWGVEMLKETGSAHVQHMVHDGERYWQAVMKLLQRAA